MNRYHELLSLFTALDSEPSYEGKINLALRWLELLPEVKEARFVNLMSISFREKSLYTAKTPMVISDTNMSDYFTEGEFRRSGGLYYPLPAEDQEIEGVLLLRCKNPMSFLKDRGPFMGIIASKLRDIFIIHHLHHPPENTPKPHKAIYEEENRELFDLLNLPLYLCHLSGRFTFANTSFLKKYGYKDIEELNQRGDFFDSNDRAEETVKLAKYGRTDGFSLKVKHNSGSIYTVRDFATLRDGYILGVFFDITDFVELNKEMKEALEIQELLNDKIMSSALVLQKTQNTSIKTLARLAEYRDQNTGAHLERICEYTRILTYELYRKQPYDYKITEQYVNDIVLSSMLHDIGKVAVPDRILQKKGDLDPKEWEVMQQHTKWGWELLYKADKELGEQSFLTLASQIALNHHEHWDGTGYPNGLSGEEIPLSARIEAIADVYDALTTERPYKHAWSHERAMNTIKEGRGRHFDPILVDTLVEIEEKFFYVYQKFQEIYK